MLKRRFIHVIYKMLRKGKTLDVKTKSKKVKVKVTPTTGRKGPRGFRVR
jgi:hypothetical protein